MGFCDRWIGWIMECIKSASLNLMVSGKKIAKLNMGRGIRQGNLLSPYLFIIGANVLSLMVQKHVDEGVLRGSNWLRIVLFCPTVFFANDALFFVNASKKNCKVLKNILDVYCCASGHIVNLDKSCIFFSHNVVTEVKNEVFEVLGIKASDDPGKYLGMPMIWGRLEAMNIDFCGEVLIKVIANAIPVFLMSCFKFLKKVYEDLDGMISKFWWDRERWRAGFIGRHRDLCVCPRVKVGIYFPKSDFTHEKKGCKASWGGIAFWKEEIRGLVHGRGLVYLGTSGFLLLPVEDWLSDVEKDLIGKIRLSVRRVDDRMVWVKSKDGEYYVKLGYRSMKSSDNGRMRKDPGRSYKVSKKLWNGIWKIRMPSKVVQFMWRVVSGALATKEALF
ncbi:uncharacterized protein LOC129310796 [Prosopis cineraria]|uniref:uncharacterized protein LOC129310796 n=1 Tax=Prosopis cineraria TaxID=364024 RepID=UPI00240F4913|nr:uncharacterized protein LOC129310796 [Prosopis cineraria]